MTTFEELTYFTALKMAHLKIEFRYLDLARECMPPHATNYVRTVAVASLKEDAYTRRVIRRTRRHLPTDGLARAQQRLRYVQWAQENSFNMALQKFLQEALP